MQAMLRGRLRVNVGPQKGGAQGSGDASAGSGGTKGGGSSSVPVPGSVSGGSGSSGLIGGSSPIMGSPLASGGDDLLGSPTSNYISSRAAFGSPAMDAPALAKFPSAKLKLDELFLHWLSLSESQRLVLNLLDDAKEGRPLIGPSLADTTKGGPMVPNGPPSAASSPKKGSSPRQSSPLSLKRNSLSGVSDSPMKKLPPSHEVVPQFFFPDGREEDEEMWALERARVEQLFNSHPNGLAVQDFLPITRDVCGFPTYFNRFFFAKIDRATAGLIKKDRFMEYWVRSGRQRQDAGARVFHVLRGDDRDYLIQDDFKPLMRELLRSHPGLEFLHDTPEFQERYAETVIYRIFYMVNRSMNGRISLREFKGSNLLQAMHQVDEEEDINRVLNYFSYEHFYVIYCKFWELDTDHDFLIDRDDLLRYGNHALTYRIVDRIFSQAPRKMVSPVENKMCYEDFVWFILSEEDKTTKQSLEYWFKCIDLDCDGFITPSEMLYFYEEHLHRMECLSQEPVLFEDIVCQMADMIIPKESGKITLSDLKRCKLSGNFFNILFNLNKFIAFETRDPFLIRQEREDPTLTEWDRFARAEYIRLSMEGEENSNDSAEVWEDSLEAPF